MQTPTLASVQSQVTELTSSTRMPVVQMTFEQQSHLFVELSILAYCDSAFATQWSTKIGFQHTQQLNVTGGLSATVFTNDTDIVVAFRGTYNVPNFVEDLDLTKVKDGALPGTVHKGFVESFDTLWSVISPVLDPQKKLWVTGHSLGGAFAAIAAVRAVRGTGPAVGGLITFGQPRIGDRPYVSHLTVPTTRYVNYLDVVPRLPPLWLGFVHFPDVRLINRKGFVVKSISILNRVRELGSNILGMVTQGLEDHNIMNYRAAIVRSYNQERANGER